MHRERKRERERERERVTERETHTKRERTREGSRGLGSWVEEKVREHESYTKSIIYFQRLEQLNRDSHISKEH